MKFVSAVLPALIYLVHCTQPVYSFLQLNGCPDFKDLREGSTQGQTQWDVKPFGNTTRYRIIQPEVDVLASCSETAIRYFILDNSPNETFITQEDAVPDELPNPEAVTLTEHYHDGFNYFQGSEYCVNALMDFAMSLRVCQPICNSFQSSSKARLCVPKCCPPDEVLDYWSLHCLKLDPEEPKWEPVVCDGDTCTQINPSETIHYHRNTLPCIRNSRQRHPLKSIETLENDAKVIEEKQK
ncbi:unnamed protein product [Orchesella dallaii]|uniref:Uncharacterized protein n=1 Tax=Orchesella dallaii TaxID=48710 RepID=A0ABP1QC99_9HEXA